MNLTWLMQENITGLMREKEDLQHKLAKLPAGHLEFTRNKKGYYRFYQIIGGTKRYIRRNELKTAEYLAVKSYLRRKLNECIVLLESSEAYLKKVSSMPRRSSNDLLTSSLYRQLMAGHLREVSLDMEAWVKESYEKNLSFPEDLKVKSEDGQLLRSKSELIIMHALQENNIKFRYDSAMIINGKKYFPDFVIIHPRTGRVLIWEHFGKMDDPAYVRKNMPKVMDYIAAGYIPNKNFIITTETSSEPLDIRLVYFMIQFFLLD